MAIEDTFSNNMTIKACTPKGCLFGETRDEVADKLVQEAEPIYRSVRKQPHMAHKLGMKSGGKLCGEYLSRVGNEIMRVYQSRDAESFLGNHEVPTEVRDYVGFCYAHGFL